MVLCGGKLQENGMKRGSAFCLLFTFLIPLLSSASELSVVKKRFLIRGGDGCQFRSGSVFGRLWFEVLYFCERRRLCKSFLRSRRISFLEGYSQ